MQAEPKANILLVDDHPKNLLALEAILEGLGQNLVKAQSGEEALRCLLHQDFAVILLDVQMPGIDGFETATLIRERQRTRLTPIIFLTAFSKSDSFVFQGYSLGAVDYLFKPIEPEILISKVSVFVDLFKKTAEVKRQAEEISSLNRDLEQRVLERTAQLEAANRLKDQLLKSEQTARGQAESAEQRFRDLVNGLGHAIFWEADPFTEKFTFVSQSAEQILGYPLDKWTEEPDFWLSLFHPDDRDWAQAFARTETLAGRDHQFEYRCVAADGQLLWLRNRAYIVHDHEGAVVKVRGLMIDITEAKQAQETLSSRAEELARLTIVLTQTNTALEKRNQELDQFAYVISHDLKAPLRAIANLSMWLEEDLEDKLSEDTQHQMNLLRGRVHRMENLINGILEYSRVGRLKTELETVSVEAILKDVIDSLAPPPAFTVEVCPGMPTLKTSRLLLEQVFSNLLSNAIKHHDRPDGCVKVTVEEKKDFYEFSVADDGPGIAPQYHERVFVIFQTLQSRDTTENTGIGLSLVKKIVESEGGMISIDSEEGEGTAFRFTWPKIGKKTE
ncbi:ATP-binding protein [Microcoleus sp. FACHB-672]|uniref:ATP-binding protein n=1 Tax=Microcoleus sp. FACHB-672 TaxID=2692825 RepID=UPI0016899B2C|nr:ATP-binding protein [Microcoleus sp. FACHB-672]MBD2042358.1 response regulator [Microcoleus sp. FACHB-672]